MANNESIAQDIGNQPLDITGKAASRTSRIKTGDDLVPKTDFTPIAAPELLNGMNHTALELQNNKRLIYEDMLRIFVAAKTPITLWGPMGSGKTRGVEAMAELTDQHGVNYQVITLQPSTEDPMVIHGMMTITEDPGENKKIMTRAIPEPAEQVWKYFNNHDGLTIMFLDEMTTCVSAQQNAMLGLLTHGKYGSTDISPYVTFVMAANPPGTVSTVIDLSEAVINRGGHIPWYSEKDHWLPNWQSGFGNPADKPKKKTSDFISMLIDMDPEIAFRDDPDHYEDGEEDDMWSIDDLCPYDQMHVSERALTETAKIFTVVDKVFEDAHYDVKRLYIQETITAMIGPRWGRNAAVVLDQLASSIGTEEALRALDKYQFNNETSLDEMIDCLGDSLHRVKGKRMVAEETKALADIFYDEIFVDDGSIMTKRYTAFWTWYATSPDEATQSLISPMAARIMNRAVREHQGEIPKKTILPSYVSAGMRSEIREIMEESKRMRKE